MEIRASEDAARIENLEAENAKLRAAAEHAHHVLNRWLARQYSHLDQFTALGDARDKLRAALRD